MFDKIFQPLTISTVKPRKSFIPHCLKIISIFVMIYLANYWTRLAFYFPYFIYLHVLIQPLGATWNKPLTGWLIEINRLIVFVTIAVNSTNGPRPPTAVGSLSKIQWKSAQRRRKHCALAVVKRSQKISPRRRPGARDGQNLISWRRSLPSPTNPVWWKSMHTISSYRGNRPTHIPTNKQTGLITIHCAAASAQCNRLSGKQRMTERWMICSKLT